MFARDSNTLSIETSNLLARENAVSNKPVTDSRPISSVADSPGPTKEKVNFRNPYLHFFCHDEIPLMIAKTQHFERNGFLF